MADNMFTKEPFWNLLSFGNAKLAPHIGIFNILEYVTCPGRTPLCEQICYAQNRRCTKYGAQDHATRLRERNYRLSLRDDFPEIMSAYIRKFGVKAIRIHESGDIYSQEYLNKWDAIARAVPYVTFLMYTKSFKLFDFSKVSDNIIVYKSVDDTSPGPIPDSSVVYVLTPGAWQSAYKKLNDFFLCPTHIMHKKHIRQYCGSLCKRCWLRSPRIAFIPHGVKVAQYLRKHGVNG